MLIRAKYHWLCLHLAAVWFVSAFLIEEYGTDHFMVPIYMVFASSILVFWSTTYTTLSNGRLKKQILFFTFRSFPLDEIESIRPHKRNGKWSYGTVVTIWSKNGQKLTLQPNHPKPFLEMLRQQAPEAKYLLQ